MGTEVETLFFYLGLGMFIFSCSILIMVFLFGIATKDILKNKKGLAALFLLATAIPLNQAFIMKRPSQYSYARENLIANVRVLPIDQEFSLIEFTTKMETIAYIEAQQSDSETIPFLPTATLTPTHEHSILIQSKYLNSTLYIVIKGVRYPIPYDNNTAKNN